jgi:hypothetical protein
VVLRHVAAESNRWMFRTWTLVEMVLGALLVAASWRLGPVPRALALVALAAVVAQAAGLAPAISELGRSLDFVPRPLPAAEGRRFGLLHAAYMVADLVKAGVLVPPPCSSRAACRNVPEPARPHARPPLEEAVPAGRPAAGARSRPPARPPDHAREVGARADAERVEVVDALQPDAASA